MSRVSLLKPLLTQTLPKNRVSLTLPSLRSSYATESRRKEDVFFQPDVEQLLQKLTGLDYSKVFRMRRIGRSTEKPIYQFMTEEELAAAQQETERKARAKLQMPPVMDERQPSGRVLEKDPLLAGFDVSKYVFTDITYGVPDRERIIVVREPDGTLRTADWDEQDRLNQTYFPREGRKHRVPAMFEPDNLREILGADKYEYILDRNCVQFEPDHPRYIRTAEMVYDHINEKKEFAVLYSTRHYGPMIFHLCYTRQVDEFLIHCILHQQRVEAAADTVRLFAKLHPSSATAAALASGPTSPTDVEAVVRLFANNDAVKGEKIVMALEKLKEIL